MRHTPTGTYAMVREVASTYDRCVRSQSRSVKIDVELARMQHRHYCRSLEQLGLGLVRIRPDVRFPDCCFVEHPAAVIGGVAIVGSMGVPSRVGEERAVKEAIAPYKEVYELKPPGTLEGGDVLVIDGKVYVGLSRRTNPAGVDAVRAVAGESGYAVVPVRISTALHLKSVCSYLGEDCILLSRGHFDDGIFSAFKTLVVPKEEAYASNCLAVNGKVFLPKGYLRAREMVDREGFETAEIDISEFKKGNGGLTCLSIVFS
ncbi:MAG TPA: arginine deiminase family protein [Bacteroidota bacterium]